VALVDRVADRLADEVVADRPAAQAVALEQLALAPAVGGVGERLVDVEVVAPAGELEAVEPPRRALRGEVVERQVGPLAREQGDWPGHRCVAPPPGGRLDHRSERLSIAVTTERERICLDAYMPLMAY
jgi:hypothetical protein